jgi:D-alanine-D-alanine ligase
MGGRSVEREVSFNSGRTICDHIDTDRYEVVPIFQSVSGELYVLPIKFLHRGKTVDFDDRLESEAKKIIWDDLKFLVDFVYIAVHGFYAEDGTLQGILEILKIPYLGSKVFGSACGINKIFQKKLLTFSGVSVPKDIVLTRSQVKEYSLEKIVKLLKDAQISFPCVVKPALEGSSIGIKVVSQADELMPAIRNASLVKVSREQDVLIEEKIKGMEFSCIALQGKSGIWKALPLTEVIPEKGSDFYDYEQKYMPGRASKITPARCCEVLSKKIIDACVRTGEVLNFSTLFRIDGFLTDSGKIFIIDPNSLSGMGPASFLFHQAAEAGMNHSQLINHIIEMELERYGLLDEIISEQKTMPKKIPKKKIAVLIGGESNEREVSLESGRNVCYKLSPSKYDVIPVFVDDKMNLYELTSRLLIQNSTRDIAANLKSAKKIKWADLGKIADFVFIALHGGKGENGSVQGTLEMLGLPYNGPGVLASSLCMDKYRTNNFLKNLGFNVPRSDLVTRDSWRDHLKKNKKKLSFPCILKPHDDGCSVSVTKAKNLKELKTNLENYFDSDRQFAMIEEFLSGMELTCGVFGNDDVKVLPPSYSVAENEILSIEEKFLPGAGENKTPAPLPAKSIRFVQSIIKEVYIALGCKGYSRIDCFHQGAKESPTGRERLIILEINTLPALTPATCLFHQAAEVSIKPMEFIDIIVELGFKEHRKCCALDFEEKVSEIV